MNKMQTTRIGVVGTGWWACFNHIPTLLEERGCEVAALCDRDAARVEQVGEKFGVAARFVDAAAMLEGAAPLDGVIVSTPHVLHIEPALAALQAGCHVLVEKPLATNAEDARRIAAVAKQAGREVVVPTGLNFTPWSRAAAEAVGAGGIGELRHIVCQMGSPLADLFSGQPMIETEEHMFRPPPSTWADPERAGGYAWGQLSHALAWALLVAPFAAESVYCVDAPSRTGVDMYDAASIRLRGGATMTVSGAGTVPKHRATHTDIRIFGSEGMLLFDTERARLEIVRHDRADRVIPLSQEEAAYDGALPVRHFARICRGAESWNPSDAENGAHVAEIIDAMRRSARSGEVVSV